MVVKAVIQGAYTRKDGTKDIKIYCSGGGRYKYYSTGLKVRPDQFQDGKVRRHPAASAYNRRIEMQVQRYRQKILDGVPVDHLEAKQQSKRLADFLEEYIMEIYTGLHPSIKHQTGKSYEKVLNRLRKYEQMRGRPGIRFSDIDMNWYYDYHKFLLEIGSGTPAFGNHIKIIKKVMREALERGLHENTIYQDKSFKVLRGKGTTKIYLDNTDIAKLERVDLQGIPALSKERDRFLISYYFLMRYGDSVRIRPDWLHDEDDGRYITYRAEKTGTECTVPVTRKAELILERNNYDFSGGANQLSNRLIKQVCSLAEINQPAKEGRKDGPKSAFVTTHTARRSAATNLVLEGADLELVARLGGWKDFQVLKRYLKASGIEFASRARRLNFFKNR